MIYGLLFAAYLAIVWVGLRLFVPHLGFRKSPLPEAVPDDFLEIIEQLNEKSSDDFDFLKRAYEYLTVKYYGSRIRTITNFWVAFEEPINHAKGFLPCTSQNYILRSMLVKSGRFRDQDIVVKTIPLNFFVHQYLRVRFIDKSVDVDPWSAFLGVPLGKKSAFIG